MNSHASVDPPVNTNNNVVGAEFPANDVVTRGGQGDSRQWYQNRHSSSQPNRPQHKQNEQHTRQHHGGKQQFAVLYTHQKTKKKKSWKDGRLQWAGGRATLYDANPMPGSGDAALDSTEVKFSEIQNLANGQCGTLESEKYMIQIEGPWTSGGAWNTKTLPVKNVGSAGMKKLMGKKFQLPSRKMPNFEEQRRIRMEQESKRRRVLQPGELERMYYGGGGGFSAKDDRRYGGNNGNGESYGHDRGYGSGTKAHGHEFQENFGPNNVNIPSIGTSQHNDFQHNVGQKENACPDSGYSNSWNINYSTKSNNVNGFQHMEQTSQNKGERNNSRYQHYDEVNPRSSSVNAPQPFQSNELDPSGFYDEEEEEEEEVEDAGMGWARNDQVAPLEQQTTNGNHGNSTRVGRSPDYNNPHAFCSQNNVRNKYGQVNATEGFREDSSGSHQHETQEEQPSSYNQRKSSKISNVEVCRVTDTLNALFGATTAPEEETSAPQECDNESSNVDIDRNNSNKDSTNPHHIQENVGISPSKAHNDSFLAGFLEAEETLYDDKPLAGLNSSEYELDSQQYDDIDDQMSHDDDVDCATITNARDEPNESPHSAPNDVFTDDAPEESGAAQITGLSLPSAGESSSEEEDSLSEEP
eukprot:CCRYP_003034-RA/>CCRYP_003034-RA protein AED:0.03 eAED:0.03 QI:148/1/1/1/0/0/2/50/637